MRRPGTAILLLAAGASSRMGSPKQLLSWGDTNLLGNAIAAAEASSADDVLLVLGANAELIEKSLPTGVKIVKNEFWSRGMGSSIACGMRYLEESSKRYRAILIMLGDQPLIDTDYLNQMLLEKDTQEKGIVATEYNGRAGVPAVFSSRYFSELAQLDTETGAKAVLQEHGADVWLMNAGLKTADIDTKEDYDKLNYKHK